LPAAEEKKEKTETREDKEPAEEPALLVSPISKDPEDFYDDTDEFMNSFFNSTGLLKLIYKWKIPFAIITVLALALSILFSSPLFIKPKYKSFAVVYPSNLIPYSSETPTEQMLQLFKSEDISMALIKKFDLATHYNIDTNSSQHLSRLKSELSDNINVRKTEFESIIIEAYDYDPVVACNMVKEVINLFNMKARELQREKTSEVVRIYKEQLDAKQAQIDSVQARLMTLREDYNVYDFNIQLKEYTRGYLNAVNSGRNGGSVYDSMFVNLGKHGGEYLFLGGYLSSLATSYNEIKVLYDQAVSDLTKELTYANIVTNPFVADNKSYPVRWLIVLVTTLSSILLTLIVISIIERNRLRKAEAQEEIPAEK
jgi:hypothetical protein